MSLIIYGGSMQYVGIDLMAGGASLLSTALISIMIDARHIFYGISMIDKFKNIKRWKRYMAFTLTDETYSLLCKDENWRNIDKNIYYLYISALNHLYWILGTCLGAVLSKLIKFNSTGIDFAMTALFMTVFTEQWISTKKHIYAIIGVICSVLALYIFGPDNFLIPAMLSMTLVISILPKGDTDE